MSERKSKFAGLLGAARDNETPAEPEALPPAAAAMTTHTVTRRRGKRSDPDFEQVTAYIRRDTYREVKRALLDRDGDFSELVEELLAGWLRR